MSIKILDCFIFYNELDLLNYRFNILNDIIDYFIIVESTHTFIGKEKKLFFNDNKHLFEKFNKKIIHIIVDDFPFKCSDNMLNNSEVWANEFYQRNAIKRYLDYTDNLNLNDIIIISDLDEIPDPNTLYNIKNENIIIDINILEMDFYYYNLNTKIIQSWNLCKILSYKKYKELNISCSDIRILNCSTILNGGWHLSYFGNADFIKNKIQNFSHQEFNNSNFIDLSKIEERVQNFSDLFDRQIQIKKINIKDNNYLPIKYDTYLTKFYTL